MKANSKRKVFGDAVDLFIRELKIIIISVSESYRSYAKII